ncbi:MAG: beta-hydroxyacyl-ACP dehydratase [Planctomycetota bacterium]|nr:MAG: beta-hydroxyacyl-ACP dehydratase [Planctomycetota bacterium]
MPPPVHVEALVPHRPPMLLVDEIVERSPTHIVCRKAFRADEFFVQGHFPGQPIVPGVILCECALQAGAALVAGLPREAVDPAALPVATRIDGVRLKQMVRPGDTVEIQVELVDSVSSAYFMKAKVLLHGKPAARLEFACALVPAES